MADIIQFRRGTAAAWVTANTILAEGEAGYETDTHFYKIGDGVTAWTSLSYVAETAFIWRGDWLTATAYIVNDVVEEAGSSYICIVAHTSGTFATDLSAVKWALMAQKGDNGATGATGAAGADGADGADATLPSLTAGSVVFSDGSTLAQDNAEFFWDNTNNRLGIGTASPTTGKVVIADTALAGSGSLAGSALNITQTWNTTGIPTAIKLNVTKTAAGSNPMLMDLHRDGSSKFLVRDTGETIQGGTTNTTNVQMSSGGLMLWSGRSYFTSPANSVLCMTNNAGSDFNRLQFGGTTSSYPSIKRSSTLLQARLADDSAYSGFEASTLTTATAYTVATLPAAGTAGRRAYVTDADAPTFLGTLTGGGAVVCPVFDNGSAWVAG